MSGKIGRRRSGGVFSSPYRWLEGLGPERRIVLLLVVTALVRGVLYALITPPFSAPDEKGHYDYLASLYEHGWRAIEGRERGQPPLYYLLSLPIFSAFAGQNSGLEVYAIASDHVSLASALVVRLFSVILTGLTVPIAYLSAKALCPTDRFVCLSTTGFVALVPEYGWVGASINNDNLANVFSSLVILLLLRGISRGFTIGYAAIIGALIAAGIVTKSTTLPVAFLAPVVIGLRFVLWRWSGRRAVTILGLALALSALFVASSARNVVLVPLGAVMKRSFTLDFLATERVGVFVSTLDIWPFIFQFKTFWGSFSNDSIQLPTALYGLLAVLTGASMIGLLSRVPAFRVRPTPATRQVEGDQVRALQIAVMVGIVVLEWLISFSRFYNNQSLQLSHPWAGWNDNFTLLQGRFLYPVIVPIAFLFAWGLGALVPRDWTARATWVLVAMLLAIDWVALWAIALGGHSWQIYWNNG